MATSVIKSQLRVCVRPESSEEAVLATLEANFDEVDWELCDEYPEIVFFEKSKATTLEEQIEEFAFTSSTLDCSFISYDQPSTADFSLISEIEKGLLLPLSASISKFKALISANLEGFEKVKNNAVKSFEPGRKTPEIDGVGERISAWQIHYPSLQRHLPTMARLLKGRCERFLHRETPGTLPLYTRIPIEDSCYGHLVVDSTEHTERMIKAKDSFESLGVKPTGTDFAFSQINLGVPFLGGMTRRLKGLSDPDESFNRFLPSVVALHLGGLIDSYNELGEDEFRNLTTRVSVKLSTFQGAGTLSHDHRVVKTAFHWMATSEDGIFAAESHPAIVASGFRKQGNSGHFTETGEWIPKRRPAHVIEDNGYVVASKVQDKGSPVHIPHMEKAGGRVRIIANPNLLQNLPTMVAPSFIGDTKTPEYKTIFTPELEAFRDEIAGSPGFVEFWREGWDTTTWVKEYAALRGCHSFQALMEKMTELGEFITAADLPNFDGQNTWKLAGPCFKEIFSPRLYSLMEKLWRADILGVYVDHEDKEIYYYIDRTDDPTAAVADSLLSGLGPTSILARILVPTNLKKIAYEAFALPLEIMNARAVSGSKFSFTSAFMKNTGDDSSTKSLVLWLLTGTHPKEARAIFEDKLTNDKVLPAEIENPALNAGFVLHASEEDGRFCDVSLSVDRALTNLCSSERGRSAIGIYNSMETYLSASVGTREEKRTQDLVDFIRDDIFGFDGPAHLEMAMLEDELHILEHATEFGAAKSVIAKMIGVKEDHLDWRYSDNELLEMGVPEELLAAFRHPCPPELTRDPFRFFNEEFIKTYH